MVTPSPYSAFNPHLQLVWDSTSLTNFSRCHRAYQYRQLEGWTTQKTDPALSFGLLFHKAIELKFRDSLSIEDLLGELMRLPDWTNLLDDESLYSKLALARAVVWYFDHYSSDQLEVISVDGKPAVELSFIFPLDLYSPWGEQYFLSGHLDMVASYAGEVYVVDHKTTKSTLGSYYFDRYTPDIQMSLYTLAAQVIFHTPAKGVLINGVQTMATGTRFVRGFATRTDEQLQEFLGLVHGLIRRAEHLALRSDWPMNQAACFNCRYRPICSKSPCVRQTWLEGDFIKSFWNPLEIR